MRGAPCHCCGSAALPGLGGRWQGQVARRLETLQGYDFELRHHLGRQYGNADALTGWPCAAAGCMHCPRQEARPSSPRWWPPYELSTGRPVAFHSLQRDAALTHVRS
ncbi:hypothetical protein AAFF_G00148080 [Aldrovandia affinis]|uniref:Uncharacterized protein n=1 Tax=Aldrovandia affinis TaxID=143900 RepID=A0AAD7W8Q1_9TELE|nr:hypothetical protein AAFF_G00148080 [Aldrovandia affinis]